MLTIKTLLRFVNRTYLLQESPCKVSKMPKLTKKICLLRTNVRTDGPTLIIQKAPLLKTQIQ